MTKQKTVADAIDDQLNWVHVDGDYWKLCTQVVVVSLRDRMTAELEYCDGDSSCSEEWNWTAKLNSVHWDGGGWPTAIYLVEQY